MVDNKSEEYQLVVFTVGNQTFGVDISQVREIVRLVQIVCLPQVSAFMEGVVNLRGQVLAVIDLAKKLGMKSQERGEHSRIIIAEVKGYTVGMIVDSVSEVLRISANSAESVPGLVNTEVPEHYIKGIGKLKDRLLVILDLNKMLSAEEVKQVKQHTKTTSS